ncbi:hypothetical protein MP228_004475 [Amoeboaphelidium protococcarum]|nr:hypothetical protein MP228_004475 [Amoeboaphelidium protococcarum]
MNNQRITNLLNYLQSLQPVPQSLITDLQQNQDDAYWRLFGLSRKQWQQRDSVHGNDIFYNFVYSHTKPLEFINEVIDVCFQECRWDQMRSSTSTTRSVNIKYPQITKIDLREWKDFDAAVSSFVAQLPDQQLIKFMSLPRQRNVYDESDVQAVLIYTILQMVSLCCQSLSANEDYSYFRGNCNFVSIHGAYVLGDPDQVWVSDKDNGLSKLAIELKTPWAVSGLADLISKYQQEYADFYDNLSEDQQSDDQIEKGNILCAVDSENEQINASPYYNNVTTGAISLETSVANYNSVPLDSCCGLTSFITRGSAGAVFLGNHANQSGVIFKTVDLTKNPEAKDLFDHEVRMYQELESLQGSVIPQFYAYGTLCGLLRIIVIENVGQSMTIEQCKERKVDIDAALKQIHDLGYQHGDVRPANLTIDNQGRVRIIDLERTKKADGEICEVYDSDLID